MRWSRLSIGRQIGLVAVALTVLLAAIITANVLLVIDLGYANWRGSAELIHSQAQDILTGEFGRIKQLAGGMTTDPTLLGEGEVRSQRLGLVKSVCPSVTAMEIPGSGVSQPVPQEYGFGGLTEIHQSSGLTYYGLRYVHWREAEPGRRVTVTVSSQALSKLLPQRGNARIMLLDSTGHVVACSDVRRVARSFTPSQTDIYTDEFGVQYQQVVGPLEHDGFTLVTLVSGMEQMRQQVGSILPVNIAATLLMAAVVAGAFYLLHISVSRPIGDMMDMLTIMRKRPEARIPMTLRGNQQMLEISRSFNKMMDENERLNSKLMEANVQLYQAELIRRKTDMAMLVSQINPHFLYNTLEVIKGMAYRVGSRTIAEMTRALGSIFRYSLKAPEIVTLKQEADVVKNYIMIQLARFGERFEVHMDFPEELMDQNVPKMILQPLCENAITHGLEMMEKGGQLYISARMEEGCLLLTVEDNGLGMDEQTLARVRRSLEKVSDVSSLYRMGTNGIGLVNVHGRLRMRYGEQYGLTIDSQQGKGTCVVLRMPGRRPYLV